MSLYDEYLKKLEERKTKSRIVKKFQLIGLMIAEMLDDKQHKSLYIKLAREMDEQELLSLAKKVAEMKHIEKKGAYFMKVIFSNKSKQKQKNGRKGNKKNES